MKMGNVMEMKGIEKSFPGVKALSDINFELREGEIHALIGENGAGKSTLMKVLSGVLQPDAGSILIDGKECTFDGTRPAEEAGISIIHQELNLCENITVANNIFAGREYLKRGLIDQNRIDKEAAEILRSIGVKNINVTDLVENLSVANKQITEIAKAISINCRILIMDEPTSALADKETKMLFELMERLRTSGKSIVYISHRLEEIFEMADRVTVIRDGQYIGTEDVKDIDKTQLISMMVGREMLNMYPDEVANVVQDEVVFEARNLKNKYLNDVSLTVRKGEILGVSGLVGAGRTELAKTIFGRYSKDSGEFLLDGNRIEIDSPRDAIDQGIMLVTEDRKLEGLVLILDILDNIASSNMNSLAQFLGFINERKERDMALDGIERLKVKATGTSQCVKDLSGGNQQKVILAKWLAAQPELLILDEPTRGIDVGAKHEIYTIMRELQKNGVGIIMISSELPEVLGMSDRVAVMNQGKITAVIDRAEATQENVMFHSIGGSEND